MTGALPTVALGKRKAKHIQLACVNCNWSIPLRDLDPSMKGCPVCGENIIEARYNLGDIDPAEWRAAFAKRSKGLWRYREMLPIYDAANIVTLEEGGTPLIKSEQLAAHLGLNHLYLKDERQGPTRSFKDRQATVAISAMKELGIKEVVVASTGNVAIAYAAYAARAGIKLWAFFPSLAPNEKMREAAVYGAQVIKTTGNYDQTKVLAAQFAAQKGLFLDRGLKSFAAMEGMKTMAYEIAEQLGQILEDGERWRSPDWFLQGVSGGLGPVGVGKGFAEMLTFGFVDKMPALGLIQSTGCAPMVHAWNDHQRIATPVEHPETVIATLATGNPGRAYEMLYDYSMAYGGYFEDATDEEAFNAIRILASLDGMSVEPATGVTIAGLIKMVQRGVIQPDDIVVVNISGHTLPVETQILGQHWQHVVELEAREQTAVVPEGPLTAAMDKMQDGQKAGRKVVVLEDNSDAARLIRRILEARGNYEVKIANDGEAGLALIREEMPDLVITDLMMPRMDGFTVIDTLKNDPTLSHIPIVVITAKELTVREKERLSGQIDMLLQKGTFIDAEFVDTLINQLG
ncbi:MAG: threonine synthase [Phototrophicaceae bacterium]|jgi:threonine synthase